MNLKNQNILVTGASQGIGAAISKSLLSYGGNVALHYNQNVDLAEQQLKSVDNSKSFTVQANLELPDEVERMFQEVITKMKRLDALVLNAGIFEPHDISDSNQDWWAIWKRTMAINLDAPGLLTKMALEHFKLTGGGRIIYISSRAAFRGETEEYLGYGASKGGLTSLARTVARSFGQFGIKSFIIAPGFTETAMAATTIAQIGEVLRNETSLKEITKPEDIAPVVSFICSGQMDHATGSVIDMNAGSYVH
jgi:NAD(P)-dependent dehydrogenase (short-subunit alcohol dehydrogenase family)